MHTPVVLSVLSLLLLLVAYWFPAPALAVAQPAVPVFIGGIVSRGVSVLLYALAAVIISRQTFFERRVRCMGALYMWLVAVSVFANGNCTLAVCSLLYVLSMVLLMRCQYSINPVRMLFASFLILGINSLITPLAVYLVPLFLAFGFFTNVFTPRGVVASLLGVATVFWLVLGTAYVFPDVRSLSESFFDGLPALFRFSVPAISFLFVMQTVLVLSVVLPAMAIFARGSFPTKPLLRRRFSFIIFANIYLLALFFFIEEGKALFFFWQLPSLAVLASYLFVAKETKLSNVYFVLVNVIMLAIALYWLW